MHADQVQDAAGRGKLGAWHKDIDASMCPVIEGQKPPWDAGGRIWAIEILGWRRRKKQKMEGKTLTFGSMIFRYRTWIPLVVKYGISNLTLIGRLPFPVCPAPPILPPKPPVIPPPCSSSPFTEGNPNSARMRNSFPPPNCLIFHIIADFSGA